VSTTVEQFTEPLAFHGEGPVWSPDWAGLRFVDMLAGDIVSVDPTGALLDRLHVGSVAAAFRPRRTGGMVVATERGFALVDANGAVHRLPDLWTDPRVRMNDGGCDPQGRFYCGSMAYDLSPGAGRLYRLEPTGTVHIVLSSVTISNGLVWTPDETTAYYVDSATQRIDMFDHDPVAGLSRRRPFVEIPSEYGLPDGLTVDRDGGVWVALFGGSAVRRYGPDGVLDDVITLPVSQVTACTFGGPALDELYITTSRENVPAGEQPHAGSVYRAHPGVSGLPTSTFVG
jgi:sugar lactone lactonase YvrE